MARRLLLPLQVYLHFGGRREVAGVTQIVKLHFTDLVFLPFSPQKRVGCPPRVGHPLAQQNTFDINVLLILLYIEMNEIRTKKGDIHVRCDKEDKEYIVERSKNGFGGKSNSISNLVRYAIRHIDDGSSIDLDLADALIKAISENRQSLAAVHEDINGIPQELCAIGNNLNQITKAINTITKIAREDKDEDGKTTREAIDKITAFESGISKLMKELNSKIDSYNNTVREARTTVNNVLRKEDEILTRCLVFPTVGGKKIANALLLRMLQNFKKDSPDLDIDGMTVSALMYLLKIMTAKIDEQK